MRAQSGREKIESEFLTVNYVPGGLQVADIGTKALPSSKLLGLLDLVNVRMPSKDDSEVVAAKVFGRLVVSANGPGTSQPSELLMALFLASQLPGAKLVGPSEWVLAGVICGVARGTTGVDVGLILGGISESSRDVEVLWCGFEARGQVFCQGPLLLRQRVNHREIEGK